MMVITLNINETTEIKKNIKNEVATQFFKKVKNPKIHIESKDLNKKLIIFKER